MSNVLADIASLTPDKQCWCTGDSLFDELRMYTYPLHQLYHPSDLNYTEFWICRTRLRPVLMMCDLVASNFRRIEQTCCTILFIGLCSLPPFMTWSIQRNRLCGRRAQKRSASLKRTSRKLRPLIRPI